jgi:hypothetical protein
LILRNVLSSGIISRIGGFETLGALPREDLWQIVRKIGSLKQSVIWRKQKLLGQMVVMSGLVSPLSKALRRP